MRIFAAIERILLDQWSKIKHNLGINKWPLQNLKEQRLQLKKQYLESLLDKNDIILSDVYTTPQGRKFPLSLNEIRNKDVFDTCVAGVRLSTESNESITITARTL